MKLMAGHAVQIPESVWTRLQCFLPFAPSTGMSICVAIAVGVGKRVQIMKD